MSFVFYVEVYKEIVSRRVQLMATDRQTPCLFYIGDCICFKAGKPIIADCQKCSDYKHHSVRVRYKNQKKEKLEKIRKEERY